MSWNGLDFKPLTDEDIVEDLLLDDYRNIAELFKDAKADTGYTHTDIRSAVVDWVIWDQTWIWDQAWMWR